MKLGTITVRLNACDLVTPPPVPFNVTVETPATALAAPFRVTVLFPVPGGAMLAGAKLAVTPAGNPLADNAIAALNPLDAKLETVSVVGVPTVKVTLLALEVNVKLGVVTVNETEVARVSPPPVPLSAIVEVPAAAFAATVIVAVTGAFAVTVAEENLMVTPVGAPLADSVTGDVNPPCAVSEIVAVPELPCATETLLTFGDSAKFDEMWSPQ